MSMATQTEAQNGAFAKTVDPLLKEYADRLRTLIGQVKKRASELAALDSKKDTPGRVSFAQQLFELERTELNHLLPGIERLVRQTSQQLEHGDVDDVSRVQLEARLAEVEGLIQTAHQAVGLFVSI